MEKNGLSIAAVVVGMLALVVAIVAMLSTPDAPPDPSPQIRALDEKLTDALVKIRDLKEASVQREDAERDLAAQLSRMERRVADLADRPRAQVDQDAVREALRNEVRAQWDRFRGPDRGGPENEADALQKAAGLTPEKAEKVLALRREVTEGIRNIWRENKGGDREGNMKLMNELRENVEKRIAELLTPEEREKVNALQHGHRGGQMGNPRWGRGGWDRRGRGDRRKGDERGGNAAGQDDRRAPPEEAPVF
jgi:TolA-binding protein